MFAGQAMATKSSTTKNATSSWSFAHGITTPLVLARNALMTVIFTVRTTQSIITALNAGMMPHLALTALLVVYHALRMMRAEHIPADIVWPPLRE